MNKPMCPVKFIEKINVNIVNEVCFTSTGSFKQISSDFWQKV